MRLRRIALPLTIITTILAAIHYYIFRTTARSLSSDEARVLAIVLTTGLIAMPVGMIFNHGSLRRTFSALTLAAYFWMGYFFLTFWYCVIETLVALFTDHSYSWWPLAAGLVTAVWATFTGLRAPRVVEHEINGPPSMKNRTMVQVSDLHVGMPFLNEMWLRRQVDRINGLAPEFVAITGDLGDGEFSEVSKALEPLREIKSTKFYITGNHEYIRGGNWEARLKELGFEVLHNTNRIYGKLLVAGVPDRMVARASAGLMSRPSEALKTAQAVDYRILLAHEPASAFEIQGVPCDLLLSGHTHGGQLFPFRYFVRLVQPVVSGFKRVNGVMVFAHMGTGFWGPPMRWLTRSEIVLFRWG